MQIKIVGTLSNIDEVHEVERIARVFVIEERLRNLDYHIVHRKIDSAPIKKHDNADNVFHNTPAVLTVHGLN